MTSYEVGVGQNSSSNSRKIVIADNSIIYDGLNDQSSQSSFHSCTSINSHGKFSDQKASIPKIFPKNQNYPNYLNQNSYLAPILQESPRITKKYYKSGEKIELDCFLAIDYMFLSRSNYRFSWYYLEALEDKKFPDIFNVVNSVQGQSLVAEKAGKEHESKIRCAVEDKISGLVSSVDSEIIGKFFGR